jgi:hypothetical protein
LWRVASWSLLGYFSCFNLYLHHLQAGPLLRCDTCVVTITLALMFCCHYLENLTNFKLETHIFIWHWALQIIQLIPEDLVKHRSWRSLSRVGLSFCSSNKHPGMPAVGPMTTLRVVSSRLFSIPLFTNREKGQNWEVMRKGSVSQQWSKSLVKSMGLYLLCKVMQITCSPLLSFYPQNANDSSQGGCYFWELNGCEAAHIQSTQ